MPPIKTNRAIVFGVYKPGEADLYQALENWDETAMNMPAFIETHFKSFRFDVEDLKKKVHRTIYVRYSAEGQCKGYALMPGSPHDIAVGLNEYHPLPQFIAAYQEKVQTGGIYADFTAGKNLDAFNWEKLRSSGRELFYSALRHYQAKRQKLFLEKREAFLNFFRDPLCLAGAWLSTLLTVTQTATDAAGSGVYTPIPLDDIDLPLLPPIQPFSAPSSESEEHVDTRLLTGGQDSTALPATVPTDTADSQLPVGAEGGTPVPHQLVALHQTLLRHPERGQNKFLVEANRTLLKGLDITPDQMGAQAFLLLCLADDRLLHYHQYLAPILIDEASETLKTKFADLALHDQDVQTWQKNFDSLMNNEFQTVGNLLAGIDGLYTLAQAFEGIDRDERPEIILPNCSLSKLYEKDEIRQKFETLLHGTNSRQSNLQDYIGFCVVPRVSYNDSEVADEEEFIFDKEAPTTSQAADLGDATRFGHLAAFIKYCDAQNLRIMTLVSLANNLPVNRLNQRTLEDAFLLDFVKQLENTAGARALKHVSVCLPDKIFMNELQLSFGSSIRSTPLIVTKAAYLVAAIALRNDSVSKLRQLLGDNRRYLQNGEPGLIIGPQTIWRGTEMHKSLPELLELPVASDLNMDTGLMELMLNPEDQKHSGFSLLYHEKGKHVRLRLYNTAARRGNNAYHSVSLIRMADYLHNTIQKSPNRNQIIRELERPIPRGKVMFDAAIFYINTWKPERVNYNIPALEDDAQGEITMEIM